MSKSVVAALVLVSAAAMAADDDVPWYADLHVYGTNTLRYSQYEASGNNGAGPYPFQGDMYFDEFNIYADGDFSEYDSWRAEVSGVANIDDRYRSIHNGLAPERLNFTRENGEHAIPWRFEAGDYFAYYSYLTLQRSLKGVQLELQPGSNVPDRFYSVVVTAGAQESSWRNLTPQDNFTTAASLLMHDALWGALNLNVVHNYRDNSHALGTQDRSQIVTSLAGEKDWLIAAQQLLLEGELAFFSGDHDGIRGARSGQDRSENGYFVQLSGRSTQLPLDYRVRYEQYGQDFRPNGAVVTPDRRSTELHTGWRFASGLRLRGRAQIFEDGYESSNTTRTRTYGANLSGPVLGRFIAGVTARADAFVQLIDDDLGVIGRHSDNFDISVSAPLPGGWTSRTNFFFQNLNDQVNRAGNLRTRLLNLNADHAFSIGGFDGLVTPGILVRRLRGGANHSTDVFPTLALTAINGPHALRMNYGSQWQNRKFTVSGADIATHTFNADYRFTRGQHEFGIEGNYFHRDPVPGANTDAWRLSMFWTMSFDRVPERLRQRDEAAVVDVTSTGDAIDLLALPLGSEQAVVARALTRNGVGSGVTVDDFTVYEYPVLGDVFQRQRLAIAQTERGLERTVLIIDFDDIGNRDSINQVFERVRQALIRRFGTPTRNREEGNLSAGLATDLNAQRVIRVIEWQFDDGVLRFGIPRRLDGQVRMEIQRATGLPQPRETLWSIEALR